VGRKITILGAGAIGTLAGAWMQMAGEDVTFVDKWVEHVEALNRQGLKIDGARGDHHLQVKAKTPDQLDQPLDLVFLACKSHDTRAAVSGILPLVGPDTTIVSLQNGMNEPTLIELIGQEKVVGGLPDYGGALVDPGHIEFVHEGPVYIGELDGRIDTPRIREIQAFLSNLTRAEITGNIWGRLWAKQVYSSQVIVTALVNAPIWEVFASRDYKKLAGSLVREAMAVPTALKVKLPDGDFFEPELYFPKTSADTDRLIAHIDHTVEILAKHQEEQERQGTHRYVKKASGILWDLVYRKRRSETRGLTGALVDQAHELGLAVPLNERLCQMIYEIEEGRRELGYPNLDELVTYTRQLELELP
jgi:2-dehydropantoate 2-reductase